MIHTQIFAEFNNTNCGTCAFITMHYAKKVLSYNLIFKDTGCNEVISMVRYPVNMFTLNSVIEKAKKLSA